MGNESTVLSAAEARHLLRRTGFGFAPKELAAFTGITRGGAADEILDFSPSRFTPRGRTIDDVHDRWIRYMIRLKRHAIQEKLVLFWHDHFATSNTKVGDPLLMGKQNALLRRHGKGNFKEFVKAITKDAAMMEFLDTVRNRKRQPNENYSRELQELFTLGVKDLNDNPTYEQADIVQIARALTGWTYDNRGVATFNASRHDFMADWPTRGPKVIYKTTGGFQPTGADFTQPGGEGPAEIDQVIDLIFAHRDTDGELTVARHIAKKLLTYFANATPTTADIDAVIGDSGFATTWDIGTLVRAILVNDVFYQTAVPATPPYTAATKKSVKWPVDYVVSTLRLLGMKLQGRSQRINFSSYSPIRNYLSDMGQVLLQPPSVFGWDWETAWISSSTLLARYAFATDVIRARGSGRTAFRPERLGPIAALMAGGPANAGLIVDAVTDLLGVTDQLTAAERDTLVTYLGGPVASLDLSDDAVRNTKLNGLFALVLESPAYQLH